VLAHELSHIKNQDILVNTLAVTMVGLIVLAADLSIRMMWWNGGRRGRNDPSGGRLPSSPSSGWRSWCCRRLLARLMQFAISRRRESLADVSAIEMTRYPPGMISALEKLRDDTTVVHASSRATAHLWIEEPIARVEERAPQQVEPPVRHPPAHRGADRGAARALTIHRHSPPARPPPRGGRIAPCPASPSSGRT
jgi:heat shock protein HtpX